MLIPKFTQNRRRFLQALGGGIALSPLLPWLSAHAQSEQAPRRVIFFTWPNGVAAGPAQRFWPQGGETDFTIGDGEVLSKLLKDHKADVNLLNGITNKLRPDGYHGHETVPSEILTGFPAYEAEHAGRADEDGYIRWASGESVDQLMGRELAAKGQGGLFPSVNIGVDWTIDTAINEAGITAAQVWSGKHAPIQPQTNPTEAYKSLFANVVKPGTSMAEIEDRLTRKQSVVDYVRGELNSLQPRLGSEDRQKIDAHLTALRNAERKLGEIVECSAPTAAGKVVANYDDIRPSFDAQMDLAIASLSCNLTQVITFQVGYTTWWNRLHWLDAPASEAFHHALNHDFSEEEKQNGTHQAGVWGMDQFSEFVRRLKAVPEGDGTMLDNTALVFLTDFAEADEHWIGNIPIVVAGGGAQWQTGRYLKFGSDDPKSWRAHNDLLLTMVHFLGLESVEQVGENGLGEGTLSELI